MKKPYQLRLDEEMINQVKELAESSDRSTNAEFRRLIRKSLEYNIINPKSAFYAESDDLPCIELKKFAKRERLPCETKQQLMELAFKISENALTHLEQETIDNVLTLNLR